MPISRYGVCCWCSSASIIEFSKCVRRHQVTNEFGLPVQPFDFEERRRDLGQPALHVHDRAVLVEHADLDGFIQLRELGHRLAPWWCSEKQALLHPDPDTLSKSIFILSVFTI
jgi:hypothetical protein